MNRSTLSLAASLLFLLGSMASAQSNPAAAGITSAQARLAVDVVGTYRLVSFVATLDDGTSIDLFGTQPIGYAIITPRRFMAVLTSADRRPGMTPDARVALFNSMVAYSGAYAVDGNKLITDVDVSWNQSWNGTKQGRTWSIEGDRLILVTDKGPFIRDPSRTSSGRLVWQRIE